MKETVDVYCMFRGYPAVKVTVPGTWRTFWLTDAEAELLKLNLSGDQMSRWEGIYKDNPKRKKRK